VYVHRVPVLGVDPGLTQFPHVYIELARVVGRPRLDCNGPMEHGLGVHTSVSSMSLLRF
jgi:hypothetical protein